jgi:predicted tellurium resistance membrane protein TerC
MKQPSITTLPPSPDDERRSRMRKYTIAMSVRMVCILLIFVVPGWWMWVFAIGAIVLPYIAVVLANVGDGRSGGAVRPGPDAPLSIESTVADPEPGWTRPDETDAR